MHWDEVNRYLVLEVNRYLVLVAWPLAVLNQRRQSLIHKKCVWLVDVEAEKTESSSRAAADTVQKLQRLTDNVVVGLVALRAQEVLQPQHKVVYTMQYKQNR